MMASLLTTRRHQTAGELFPFLFSKRRGERYGQLFRVSCLFRKREREMGKGVVWRDWTLGWALICSSSLHFGRAPSLTRRPACVNISRHTFSLFLIRIGQKKNRFSFFFSFFSNFSGGGKRPSIRKFHFCCCCSKWKIWAESHGGQFFECRIQPVFSFSFPFSVSTGEWHEIRRHPPPSLLSTLLPPVENNKNIQAGLLISLPATPTPHTHTHTHTPRQYWITHPTPPPNHRRK